MGKAFGFFAAIAAVGLMAHCVKDKGVGSTPDPESRKYEQAYESGSEVVATQEDSPYLNNSLSNGTRPYPNEVSSYGDDSSITVRTSSSSNCDLVAIVKRNGSIVRNAYIRAGGSYTFDVPNGTYQVFFYAGKGWNPNKDMPGGLRGGFVANESYSKDTPTTLQYQSVEYELIPQAQGNFSTLGSSASEVF